ncbi:hypothetical protein Glove_36g3 [Diversispora epigaea]|uniref:Uncharacterized protein n=1 Tax=Diversispora epigaea TaxID=1348612 RepID=A0A397JN28_9GLOM|nr:hypothetical protein Glove_36g3 [Diversispora epigaea]
MYQKKVCQKNHDVIVDVNIIPVVLSLSQITENIIVLDNNDKNDDNNLESNSNLIDINQGKEEIR